MCAAQETPIGGELVAHTKTWEPDLRAILPRIAEIARGTAGIAHSVLIYVFVSKSGRKRPVAYAYFIVNVECQSLSRLHSVARSARAAQII